MLLRVIVLRFVQLSYLMRLGASLLPQSMYSPVRIVDCYKHQTMLTKPSSVLKMIVVTYTAELSVALDLDSNKEHAAVKEEHVAFPPPGVVVSLSVDGSRHGPDSSSSHFVYPRSIKL